MVKVKRLNRNQFIILTECYLVILYIIIKSISTFNINLEIFNCQNSILINLINLDYLCTYFLIYSNKTITIWMGKIVYFCLNKKLF